MVTDADPFGTASLRGRVLAAWAASPARFREDANAEDDLVRGGYRDRVVVELAQNAADAAARAGVPGRLLLHLDGNVLRAANTGAPLDAVGVEALSTLRASAKRDASTVGRFGVGFAAVLALTDEPRLLSSTGGARWDAVAARAAVASVPSLATELERRGGHVPVLRLPFPARGQVPERFDTVVELPLRDAAARALAERLLTEVDATLLLALPALSELVVDVDGTSRTVSAGQWQVVRRYGDLPANLLADRPVEERDRPFWTVTWARPLDGGARPGVLLAPTPTDEPLDLPALLIGTFPLDPTRRHVAPGALTDWLVDRAADAYLDLVLDAEQTDRLALVPGPAPAGRLDGQLRTAIGEVLRGAPWLQTVDGSAIAPRDAVSVVGAAAEVLAVCAAVVPGLVPDARALARLSVRRISLADLVDQLGRLDRPPAWWGGVYAALAAGPVDADALGALPVPLVDGRLVRGPRGALLGDGLSAAAAASAATLGLRLVDPAAASPLLARLGAELATPLAILGRPEVGVAADAAWEHPDPAEVSDAVLTLVAESGARAGDLPGLAGLPLPDADGELAAADELVLPGSVLADLADPATVAEVAPELVVRWGADVLTAVGVLDGFTVGEVSDVALGADGPPDAQDLAVLAELGEWLEAVAPGVRAGAVAGVVRGVRELDVLAEDRWPEVLRALADDPAARAALLDRVTASAAGVQVSLPSYTAWLLRSRARLDGSPPTELALAGSELAGLYPPVTVAGVPDALLTVIGVRSTIRDLLAEPGGADELLDRLAKPDVTVSEDLLADAYEALAEVSPQDVRAPHRLRVRLDLVVAARDVVLVDEPQHLQLAWPVPPLVVPLQCAARLGDALDLPLSSRQVAGRVDPTGTTQPVPTEASALVSGLPRGWCEHESLVVDGVEVSWWVDTSGTAHASTIDGLARALAWSAREWSARWALAAVLAEPGRLTELRQELRLDR